MFTMKVGLLADMAADGGGMFIVILLVALALTVFLIAGIWKTFAKAGEPGWACIVPIYNVIVMLKVARMPMWWIVLMFIPFVSIIPGFVIPINIAKQFGKDAGFGIGLVFLPFIFYPILGFGDAQYQGAIVPQYGARY